MSMIDPLGDMLTRIRNALLRNRSSVRTPASKLRQRVLDVLLEEGFIRGYSETTDAKGFKEFEIELKYFEGAPVINDIKRVSKPGRREYRKVRDLPLVRNGLGIAIVSTPKGVMSDAAAREANVGGEILCHIS
ncbi:30S ribosomal protein S8 [Marinicauda algicola]|uniref:Small ribosomal subunit protein uS8 n=1 Tax=Marinicauda algicola TaxID=2029849 RepID=A0A4S2GVW7_9PROT|nr:30S ribosomal protein S8 [Marinicauda algicola]TGY87163.1 30S ribosomal protein S8 [Marinicauda algicola]